MGMKARDGIVPSRHAIVASAFLACAIVLGGGGSPNPGTEILLQLVFVAAALAWLWLPPQRGMSRYPQSIGVWLIGALVLALPLAQLLPLPPGVWKGLAGQEDRAAALALVGRADSWQALSHSPSLTFASALAIVPALFAFFATAALDTKGRSWVVGTMAAMVLAAALLGAMQVSLGSNAPYLYLENNPGVTGFQANRNAAADVMLIGMVASAAVLTPALVVGGRRGSVERPVVPLGRRAAGICLGGLLVILLFATVLTASRMGIALLPVTLLAIWLILRPALADLGAWRFLPPAAALAAAMLVLLAVQAGNTALVHVADRFDFAGDFRQELWRDGWFSMSHAWPFGIGMGGAEQALIAAERLEILDPAIPNRVHNDYLELALEGGAIGLALLAAVAAVLGRLAWRTWRDRPRERHLTACGLTMLLIVALHSFVDYPLRSMALACLIGTGAGLLVASPRQTPAADALATASRG
jgi:O-antigen ligase